MNRNLRLLVTLLVAIALGALAGCLYRWWWESPSSLEERAHSTLQYLRRSAEKSGQ